MRNIGGNTVAILQVKHGKKNKLGTCENQWNNAYTINGWLDLQTGDSQRLIFDAKIQQSTHIFICDYEQLAALSHQWRWDLLNFNKDYILPIDDDSGYISILSENARMIINGKIYEILLIDNPMNMNEHLEIYLRFVGGQ